MSDQPTRPDDLTLKEKAIIVETSEANLFRSWSAMPAEVLEAYGASWQEVGGATAAFFGKFPLIPYNRVVGLGLHQPATPAIVDELIELYGRTHQPYGFSICPVAQPAQLEDWLLERGFKYAGNWVKMIRGNELPPEQETEFRLEVVDESLTDQYAEVLLTAFDVPNSLASFVVELAQVPGRTNWLAFSSDKPAAVGSLKVSGECGTLFAGGTLPEFRRRGAQGALMAERIRKGVELGYRWFNTETSEDTPEHPNPSYRNMIRAGFELAYLRPGYWHDAEPSE